MKKGESPSGRGEMEGLIAAFDWSGTTVGPREQWPLSLRTIVDVMIATRFPMALLWGRDLILIYNDAYMEICADKHPAALGRSTREVWPEVWHINRPIFEAVMDRGETRYFEDMHFPILRRGAKTDAYFTLCYSPVRLGDGGIGGTLVVLEETTARKAAAEDALRKGKELLDEMGRMAHVGGWEVDIATGEQLWTEEVFAIHEVDPLTYKPTAREGIKFYAASAAPIIGPAWRRAVDRGESFDLELEFITAKGRKRWVRTIATPHWENGKVTKVKGTFQDITERKNMEQAFKDNQLFLQAIIDGASDSIVFVKDLEGHFILVNRYLEKLMGKSRDELLGKTDYDFFPEEMADYYRSHDRRIAETHRAEQLEEVADLADGKHHVFLANKFPLFDSEGKVFAVAAISSDITQLKQAEGERARMEAQLRETQKMETVGRLAGGMAHEFNNLLQGIMGYTELCRSVIAPDDPLGAHLNEIDVSSIRAVNLIRKLLGFARKQIIMPKRFDLNEHITGFIPLLRTLIRETIELIWMPGAGHMTVMMDASQIDQVLVNLAANACDAIRGTGRITLTTATTSLDASCCADHCDAIRGKYAMLTFGDTGCGMEEAIKTHLFEPFFTTKEFGKGTGMGLATLYGIVHQNNGCVTVESEPGKGTTFRIYLPLYDGEPVAAEVGQAAAAAIVAGLAPFQGGRATILLVDDDPVVLKIEDTILHGLGYTVLAAASPEQALRLEAEYAGPIDLLLTDVVMPGQNGRELADRLMARRPQMKCIYMSGYTADIVAQHGILEEREDFLSKPFNREELANKLREVLHRSGPGGRDMPEKSPG